MSLPARAAAVIVAGLLVGAVTSVLQKYLDSPWLSLVDSASPWLAPMFVLGAFWPRPRGAAVAGLMTGLLELAGYYVTAAARGFSAGHAILLFWAACAVIGGPVFGLGGWLWWHGPKRFAALGAAVLPAAFLAEAAVSYGWRLRGRQHARAALWLLALFPAGVGAELILGLVYSQSF